MFVNALALRIRTKPNSNLSTPWSEKSWKNKKTKLVLALSSLSLSPLYHHCKNKTTVTRMCQSRIFFLCHVIATQSSLASKLLQRSFLPFSSRFLSPSSSPSLHSPTTSFSITLSSHTIHRLPVLCKSGTLISCHLGLIATTVRLRLYPPYLYSAQPGNSVRATTHR